MSNKITGDKNQMGDNNVMGNGAIGKIVIHNYTNVTDGSLSASDRELALNFLKEVVEEQNETPAVIGVNRQKMNDKNERKKIRIVEQMEKEGLLNVHQRYVYGVSHYILTHLAYESIDNDEYPVSLQKLPELAERVLYIAKGHRNKAISFGTTSEEIDKKLTADSLVKDGYLKFSNNETSKMYVITEKGEKYLDKI